MVAGTWNGGFGGDGGPATNASLFAPHDLAFDAEGNLFIADTYNHRIRRIDARGLITTVAGNGKAAYTGDIGPATQASLNNPQGIAFDRDGALLIADTFNHVVRRVDSGSYKRSDYVYGNAITPVRFWTEAASPEDINNGEAKSFLCAFGQANREQFDRQPGGSILQAMTLMNSPFVTRRVTATNGSLVEQLTKSSKSGPEIVDELYLATLSRYPSPAEKQLAIVWID